MISRRSALISFAATGCAGAKRAAARLVNHLKTAMAWWEPVIKRANIKVNE